MPNTSAATRIAIVGAGLMGHGIAQAFMTAGFQVNIWDPSPEALEQVTPRVSAHLEQMGINQPITITLCDTLADCVRNCDMMVEAIPENLEMKRKLLQEVDTLNPNCLIATNTSVLRITEIAEGSRDPGRVVGTHWWNPPYLIPVVEVVYGEATRPETAQVAMTLLRQAGKIPVEVLKDVPGFVGNRMQFALIREALHIVEEGICTPETVDLVAQLTFGQRLPAAGPLRNADFIGLDLTAAILEYLSPHLSDAKTPSPLLAEKIQENALGAKTGEGLYPWPSGEKEKHETKLLQHLIQSQTTTPAE